MGAVLAPSILSAEFARLGADVKETEAGGAALVHVDVMDGRFVPNLTVGPVVPKALARATRVPFDVYLMIEEPLRTLDQYLDAGAARVAVHVEAEPNLHRFAQHVRGLGASPGVAINPGTSLGALDEAELVVREAERAVREGAVELDIVLPWGLLVERRFSEVVGEVREISVASGGIPLKLIVEASEMDDDLLGSVIHEIVLPSGAAFLKTGTGVFNKPLSSQQIRRLRQRLPTSIGLKVSGGLRSAEAVLEAFEAGADVVGTSRTLDILEALATAEGQL